MQSNRLIFVLFILVVFSIFVIYFATNTALDADGIVMPLDDVYIHFQYARQLASGEPYVYNPSDGATSGATSFIYPYLLAVGYLLGFQGLNLGIWAMLIGCLALLASMWAIYRLCLCFDAPQWLAVLTPISFALTGSVSWHAMSGMEALLIVCFALWTLLAFVDQNRYLFVLVACLLALTRPEGSIMAVIASGLFVVRIGLNKMQTARLRRSLLFVLPLIASAIQPTLNYLLTGSASASGSQAKSLLGVIPQDMPQIITRIIDHWLTLWLELFTGYNPTQDIWYLIVLTVPAGLIGLLWLLRQREHRLTAIMILLWLGGVSAAIATLDTAFWHFKRYQLPLMAICVPLSVIPIVWQLRRFPRSRWFVYAFDGMIVPLFVVMTLTSFLNRYTVNIQYVQAQPLAMARWLASNTPEDAVVAVHDVGMMRYMGQRKTLDIVGLTTPDAAQYWRNGVGAVAEFLLMNQPDYIASYGRGHGYGLYMLEDTRLYADPLFSFSVDLDLQMNVALAADKQAIYQPDWSMINTPSTASVLQIVNVANIDSEIRSHYHWENTVFVDGFATVVYDFDYIGCDTSHSQSCQQIDGARQMTGEESFMLNTIPESDILLETRVHPIHPITLDIFVDDTYIDTQWIPENPGHWLDIQTRIPQEALHPDAHIRIIPRLQAGQVYVPARHQLTAYQIPATNFTRPIVATYQDDHLTLLDYTLTQQSDQLSLQLTWFADGETTGDYRFFVHLYADTNQPPSAQWDSYLGDGTLPLGNWLEGIRQDTINVTLDGLDSGIYQLAIGFYGAHTHERLIPISDNNDDLIVDDGRLFLETVEID